MPLKYDSILADEGEYVFSESVTSIPDAATSEAKTSVSKPKSVGEPLIKDCISESEDENETKFKSKQRKPSFAKTKFVKSNEHVKTPRGSVKKIENKKQAKYPRKNSQSPRDCDLHEKKMVEKTVWNNAKRANHQNSQRMSHPHPKRNFVPKAVLMKSGIKLFNTAGQNISKVAILVNTARPINTAYTRPTVNSVTKALNVLNKAHTHVRRPFNKSTTYKNSNLKEKVNTFKGDVTTDGPKAVVSNNKGNKANAVKASTCWVWRPKQKVLDHASDIMLELQEKRVIDSGCSRYMTGNKSYLSNYEEIDGRFVAFGGDPKGGRITGKGKISTGSLTFLFAKATLDESNLWHRRLGHINFKTLNKLVRGNLVRGLPSKTFENNHTCVAFQKGKQHKASCKTKTISSISQPLQMLHLDLFGLTFVKSLMKKMYCLVVIDNYSRFSWVLLLATKDETSEILKTFIIGIENIIDLKVKVIICDNGTGFKNKVMNQFCEMKGIKREFSVVRTPQQKGVAERKNKTLIEASRTMLADLKLPATFWAEAVNTACYVQNRMLVIKPHNKTLYELFLDRKLALSFMRPFGCPVTILNTLDHLGKFNGKADEEFFVGYSTNSKAYKVFNNRTRIVEENLHVTFSEETPNIAGNRPNWLFDIDSLTISMNYKPVVVGNQTNGNAGTKENIDTSQDGKKIVPDQKYILLPLLTSDPSLSKSSKDSADAGFKPSGEEETINYEHQENEDSEVPNIEEPRVNQEQDENVNNTNNINNVSLTVSVVDIENNDVDENIVYGCIDDPNMPNLEEIIYSNNDEEVDAEADMNNLATNVPVSPIPTTRVHKDHPLEQIIRDIHSTPQTRRMIKNVTKHVEPKKVIQTLIDLSWIEAMQDKLLQFKLQKVWTLVDLPYGKRVIGTKWVYKTRKMIEVEKALYGLHQAPRAWYETLSTYLLENGFRRGTIDKTLFIKKDKGDILLVHVYVDDIIFGSTKKSLCVEFEQMMHKRFQMSSMGELTFFLGLQVKQKDDGIFISQDKYVDDILKKFNFDTVKITSTLIKTNKALFKDEEAEDVDVYLYILMIGSLMYLTASRPDIIFAVCACARFQVTPKVSHLHAVKRIFRYLKGQPKLGLWYPRDSPFDLEAFFNSDYDGASLDKKSTTGEYVAAANCYGQVLWIENQMLDYGFNFMNTKIHIHNESTICIVKNPVFHSKTKHIEIRHHFIRNSYEKKLIQVIKIHTDHNVADILTKDFDVSRPIHLVVDETIYKKWEDKMERAATTASSLEAKQDSGNINRTQSIATLNESFPQGTGLGSGPRCQDTILGGAKYLSLVGPLKSLEAEHDNGNINRTQNHGTLNEQVLREMVQVSGPQCLRYYIRGIDAQTRFETTSKLSNDPPLSRVDTLGSKEDIMKLMELMALLEKIAHIDKDEGLTLFHIGPSVSITTAKLVTTAGEGFSTTRATPENVSNAEPDMDVTLTEALVDLLKSGKKKSPKPNAMGISFQDAKEVARRAVSTSSGEISSASKIITIAEETVSTAVYKGDSKIEKEVMKRPGFDLQQNHIKKNEKTEALVFIKKRPREDADEESAKM
ncbi:putative ribonuclease H-like domain-containing protein [Tanacetum coccineum]